VLVPGPRGALDASRRSSSQISFDVPTPNGQTTGAFVSMALASTASRPDGARIPSLQARHEVNGGRFKVAGRRRQSRGKDCRGRLLSKPGQYECGRRRRRSRDRGGAQKHARNRVRSVRGGEDVAPNESMASPEPSPARHSQGCGPVKSQHCGRSFAAHLDADQRPLAIRERLPPALPFGISFAPMPTSASYSVETPRAART